MKNYYLEIKLSKNPEPMRDYHGNIIMYTLEEAKAKAKELKSYGYVMICKDVNLGLGWA